MRLYYTKSSANSIFVGCADADYKSNTSSCIFQIRYISIKNNVSISWKLVKRAVTATSTNHSKLLAFHEAVRKSMSLRTMNELIMKDTRLDHYSHSTFLHEDNSAYVTQMRVGFIKTNRTKHIRLQLFKFSQEFVWDKKIKIRKVGSSNNIPDMLIKVLMTHSHRRLIDKAKMRLLHELLKNWYISFTCSCFPYQGFLWVKLFNWESQLV